MITVLKPDIEAQTPCGLNHIVLKVRDIQESHRFWTELLGFHHVGTVHRPPRAPMRFYSGERNGKLRHHDIALVEEPAPTAGPGTHRHELDHVAIEYATETAWRRQIAFLTARGVVLRRRVDRGVTRSIHVTDPNGHEIELVHELPREIWEHDIQAALDHAVVRAIDE
jgi:catechol 2,3-dioxygenase